MYSIVDNFLGDGQFKSIREWISDKITFTAPGAYWPEKLMKFDDVEINGPNYRPAYDYLNGQDLTGALKVLNPFHEKIINHLNDNVDKYKLVPSNGRMTRFRSYVYRYKKGSGILIHTDNNREDDKFRKRYGITYYVNEKWHPNWGGETLLYESKKEGVHGKVSNQIPEDLNPIVAVLPKRNRLMIVDDLWHKVYPNMNPAVDRLVIQSFLKIESKNKTEKKNEDI